jgi:hypothetical protein
VAAEARLTKMLQDKDDLSCQASHVKDIAGKDVTARNLRVTGAGCHVFVAKGGEIKQSRVSLCVILPWHDDAKNLLI